MLGSALKFAAVGSVLAFAGIYYLNPNAIPFPKALKTSLKSFPAASLSPGPVFGLKISLILVSFYLLQGLTSAFFFRKKKTRNQQTKSTSQIPFHFMEIPILLAIIVPTIAYIPQATIQRYIKFLAGISPILTILELVSTMTVIRSFGQYWSPRINQWNSPAQFLVLMGCVASFAASTAVVYFIYKLTRLSIVAASCVSSLLTTIFIEVLICCRVDYATITDPALIFPYLSYNLVLIAWREVLAQTEEVRPDSNFIPKSKMLQLLSTDWFGFRTNSLGLIKDILGTIFSPILIFHLIFQLAIIVFAAKLQDPDEKGAETEEAACSLHSTVFGFLVNRIWPHFGKSFLVLIYTVSWLDQSHPKTLSSVFPLSQLPWYLDSFGFWRWIVAFGTVIWYGFILFIGDFASGSRIDAEFWKQFQ